ARARAPAALRVGDRVERTHPPGAAESRGARHLSHCVLDGLPSARAGQCARSRTGHAARGAAARAPGAARGELPRQRRSARADRLEARLAVRGHGGVDPRTNGRGASEARTEDAAHMRALAAGDPEALRELYGRHGPALFAIAARALDPATAEEIVQDVFLA